MPHDRDRFSFLPTRTLTVGDQPTLILPYRPGRVYALIANEDGAVGIRIGDQGSIRSGAAGFPIAAGASRELAVPFPAPLYAVSASGNVTVSVLEVVHDGD